MIKNRVREIRKMRKLTIEELAEKLKVPYSTIQKLDAGAVDLDTQWMRKLSAALDVKPYELLPREMQPEEITPEEREILRMIRKSSAPQNPDNKNLPQQTPMDSNTPSKAKLPEGR